MGSLSILQIAENYYWKSRQISVEDLQTNKPNILSQKEHERRESWLPDVVFSWQYHSLFPYTSTDCNWLSFATWCYSLPLHAGSCT